jgi:hypothetical protein
MKTEKIKPKIDNVVMRLGHDRNGYTAFFFDLSFQGKLVTCIPMIDVSHRRACDKIANHISKHYQSVNNEN